MEPPLRRARSAAAWALAASAFAVLAVRAARETRPFGASIELAGKFWKANAATRMYNSPLVREDREFGERLWKLDREWPPDRDVVLAVPESAPEAVREARRRMAAYLLAPRRVLVRLDKRRDFDVELLTRGP